MGERLLIHVEEESQRVKSIMIFDSPERLSLLLNKLTWRILLTLGKKEMYPMEVARKLGIHEQVVYYHIKKLIKAEVLEKVREEERKGAIAKYYRAKFAAYGVELPYGEEVRKTHLPRIYSKELGLFFNPIVSQGVFNGKIVVGSPDPHGPFKTSSRDGHYSSYLAFFLGQFAMLPEEFPIKLDVDVKAEKEEANNLLLVGGPGTNLLTQEINTHLPVRFDMKSSKHGFVFGGLISSNTGRTYTQDTVGLIAKVPNPWEAGKFIITFAGNKAVGTKASVLAIVKFSKRLLKDFKNEEVFTAVIQGFDLDGDGKVDSVEILE